MSPLSFSWNIYGSNLNYVNLKEVKQKADRLPRASVSGRERQVFLNWHFFLILAVWVGTVRGPESLFVQASCLGPHTSSHPTHSTTMTTALRGNTDLQWCFVKQKLCFWRGASELPGLGTIWREKEPWLNPPVPARMTCFIMATLGGLAVAFHGRWDRKYAQLCGPCKLCNSCTALPGEQESQHRE